MTPYGGGGPSASLQVECFNRSSSSSDGFRFLLTVAIMGFIEISVLRNALPVSSISHIYNSDENNINVENYAI